MAPFFHLSDPPDRYREPVSVRSKTSIRQYPVILDGQPDRITMWFHVVRVCGEGYPAKLRMVDFAVVATIAKGLNVAVFDPHHEILNQRLVLSSLVEVFVRPINLHVPDGDVIPVPTPFALAYRRFDPAVVVPWLLAAGVISAKRA